MRKTPKTLYGLPIVEEDLNIDTEIVIGKFDDLDLLTDYVTVYLPSGDGGFLVRRDLAEQLLKMIPGSYI